jgi:hypothetical protein
MAATSPGFPHGSGAPAPIIARSAGTSPHDPETKQLRSRAMDNVSEPNRRTELRAASHRFGRHAEPARFQLQT